MSDYTLYHHADMLSDNVRLTVYHNAIKSVVGSSDIVVDIGAGTGILSAYAAKYTKEKVFSIEYFDFPARLLQKMIDSNGWKNICLIQQASFNVDLSEHAPNVLISETIGQIGPEEKIVEIFYDFCRRHPSIIKCIPFKLSIKCKFVYSEAIDVKLRNINKQYASASFEGFDYQHIFDEITNAAAGNVCYLHAANIKEESSSDTIVEYILGKSKNSEFSYSVNVNEYRMKFNALHLYFEAQLDSDNILSSNYLNNTHWGQSFIPFHMLHDNLTICYKAGAESINIAWE